MQAEEYLNYIYRAELTIKNKKDELEHLRSLLVSVIAAYGKEAVQSSGAKDKLGEISAMIIDLERELPEEINRLMLECQKRKKVIEMVSDANEYDVLYQYYVLHRKLTEITRIKGYSYVWICKLHEKALESVQKILNSQKSI